MLDCLRIQITAKEKRQLKLVHDLDQYGVREKQEKRRDLAELKMRIKSENKARSAIEQDVTHLKLVRWNKIPYYWKHFMLRNYDVYGY